MKLYMFRGDDGKRRIKKRVLEEGFVVLTITRKNYYVRVRNYERKRTLIYSSLYLKGYAGTCMLYCDNGMCY